MKIGDIAESTTNSCKCGLWVNCESLRIFTVSSRRFHDFFRPVPVRFEWKILALSSAACTLAYADDGSIIVYELFGRYPHSRLPAALLSFLLFKEATATGRREAWPRPSWRSDGREQIRALHIARNAECW
jgi:hypothetical protein